MRATLLECDGNQTERKVEDLSQTAMALVALLLENSEDIGYKPKAKGVLLRWIQVRSSWKQSGKMCAKASFL